MTAAPADPKGPKAPAALRLQPGERLIWKGPAAHTARSGTLACTDRRVLWFSRRLFGTRRAEWTLDAVERIELKAGPGPASVLVWARNGKGAAFQVSLKDSEAFASAVGSARRAAKPGPASGGAPGKGSRALARARLQRIERLRRQGRLTDAECQAERDGARR